MKDLKGTMELLQQLRKRCFDQDVTSEGGHAMGLKDLATLIGYANRDDMLFTDPIRFTAFIASCLELGYQLKGLEDEKN